MKHACKTKTVKILAVGNSFSVDAMEYLWNICRAGGVETVILGNLYIGGCSLARHWRNIVHNAPDYTYYKNTDGTWQKNENTTVQQALTDENWDIITLQQASGDSGMSDSFGDLPSILEYLDTHKTNSQAKFLWHMTWAYQSDSTHAHFARYGNDQTAMYRSIIEQIQKTVSKQERICGVIPSGTAIQNLRSSRVGDTVTRDGYHLSFGHGRYTAALTWFAAITGGSIESVDWTPESEPDVFKDLDVIRESVRNALNCPWKVTACGL